MTKDEFERVASRLGAEAREHPRRYRARVLAFGALGYAYVFTVMAALLAVVIALGWRIAREGGAGAHALVKLAISAAVLWVAVLRSIWVRIDPPVGDGAAARRGAAVIRGRRSDPKASEG